jgi:hypothetical protein
MRLKPSEQSFTVSEIPMDNMDLTERQNIIDEKDEHMFDEIKEKHTEEKVTEEEK